MPFYDNDIHTVVEQYPFADITRSDYDKKPIVSSVVLLNGGVAGGLGEKSYEPEVFLSQLAASQTLNNLSTVSYDNYSYKKIKSKNDTGYAIKFETDVSNVCDLTIGHYNSSSGIDIYSSSDSFKYSTLYSGSLTNGNTLYDGSWFGEANNFQLVFPSASVNPIQDTDLSLNKYYLQLRDALNPVDDARGQLFLQSNPISTTNLSSLFAFYVVELDLFDNYSTYTTANFTWNKKSLTISSISINSNSFSVGDVVQIKHPDNYFYIQGTVSASSGTTIALTMTSVGNIVNMPNFNLPTNTNAVFPIGSKVYVTNFSGNNLSLITDKVGDSLSYKELFKTKNNTENNGFNYKIQKEITSSNKEVFNSVTFTKDKFANFSSQVTPINKTVQRIGNRDYLIDQYGSDSTKLQIKNKSKLGIVYHGVENLNNVWTYFCGNEKDRFAAIQGTKPTVLNSQNVYLIVGNSTFLINGKSRSYNSTKLYEVLLYKNLSSSNIPVVVNSLIEKYKERLFFSSSVEFQNSAMYYSQTDRINILGKIIKNS